MLTHKTKRNAKKGHRLIVKPFIELMQPQYAGASIKNAHSEPLYHDIYFEEDARIPMSDGITLSADIYRPNKAPKVPALLSWSAYNRSLFIAQAPMFENECGTGVIPNGYAHVLANKRGTDRSDGEVDMWFSEGERKDLCETIAWIAKQEWCDGTVGMLGVSYFSMSQLLVASQHPPALKAIFVYDFSTDIYRHIMYYGGAENSFFMSLYAAANGSGQKKHIPSIVQRGLSYVLNHPFIRTLFNHVAGKFSEHLVKDIAHPTKPFIKLFQYFFKERYDILDKTGKKTYARLLSKEMLQSITIPICIGATPSSVSLHQFGSYDAWHYISSKEKYLFIGPKDNLRPWTTYAGQALDWYDFTIKKIDNGYAALSRVRYFVDGKKQWESASDWPLPNAKKVKFFLAPVEKYDNKTVHQLVTTQQNLPALDYIGIPMAFETPIGFRESVRELLSYQTAPLEADLKIVGPVKLSLTLSCNAIDTFIFARISDKAPDGTLNKLSFGCLLASARRIDAENSTPTEIVHATYPPQPLAPYEAVTLVFSLTPLLNVFQKGHSLVLDITSRSDLAGASFEEGFFYFHRNEPPYSCVNTIYHGQEKGCSFLELDSIE